MSDGAPDHGSRLSSGVKAGMGVAAALVLGACADPPAPAPPTALTGYVSATYARAENWLCRPGRTDVCNSAPVGVRLNADGSTTPLETDIDADRDRIDCFYVYPTANGSLWPGNIPMQDERARIEAVARAQTAMLSRSCRVFAPRYRQVSVIGYLLPEEMRRRHAEVAASDVIDAFAHYMANENGGRRIVLVGHSQGAEVLTYLIQRRFDPDPGLQSRLTLAVLAGFPIYTRQGSDRGATFRNVPICRRPAQVGCVVTYRVHRFGSADVKPDDRIRLGPDQVEACVNPATLDRRNRAGQDQEWATLSKSIFSRTDLAGSRKARFHRPMVGVDQAYEAICAPGPDARTRYLGVREVTALSDPRHGLVSLNAPPFMKALGLHHLDLQFPASDIRNLVATRNRARDIPAT